MTSIAKGFSPSGDPNVAFARPKSEMRTERKSFLSASSKFSSCRGTSQAQSQVFVSESSMAVAPCGPPWQATRLKVTMGDAFDMQVLYTSQDLTAIVKTLRHDMLLCKITQCNSPV